MNNVITSKFCTREYHGYNIKFSPFKKNLLACAASENYGITGKGKLFVLDVQSGKAEVNVLTTRDWPEGLYDVTWSELNPNLLVTSCCDGSIQIWDYLNSHAPVAYYKIHEKEVYSVDWNPQNAFPYILSASWDNTIKVWNPFQAREIASFLEHTDQVYEACWSRCGPEIFASVAGDRLYVMDIGTKTSVAYPLNRNLCCD
ncbi:hypothetical protein JTE90_022829 [Oedothorax gibbosus]|uniref:Peroxin-7 n=1 Tax=Oedothorax gibbosus TaxID=931172 RepID=A0AAV6V7F6_9ARAC|nr:hypothetical protein JTE90_022829 [Oedothorax gibbosus]